LYTRIVPTFHSWELLRGNPQAAAPSKRRHEFIGKEVPMSLIGPDQLEADAVVPQCLDNQYVSDRLFSYLTELDADYNHPEVRKMRAQEVQTEFVRSLVYSSQVVINRAFMKNNEYLYRNYQTQSRDDFLAFARLLREKAVVPFLFTESSLVGNSGLALRDEGERAIQGLDREVGEDIVCVRMAVDDTANDEIGSEMARQFAQGLTRIRHLDPERRNAMASELFREPQRLHETGCWEAFNEALTRLAVYAFQKGGDLADQGGALTRTHVYGEHFVNPSSNDRQVREAITLGRFRKPDRDNPFVLELKKLVDLVYNTNLPDLLGRYTFTPVTLPSRTALQDKPAVGAKHTQLQGVLTNQEALYFIRRTFMDETQRAMNLPLLRDLTMADVVELRRLPEWEKFKDSQKLILTNPLRCLDYFEHFQNDFDAFQRAMSEWYNRKYERPRTEERYVSIVSFVLQVAGRVLVMGLGKEHPLGRVAAGFAPDLIPKKVKGYAAKLMVGVYDKGQKHLDKDRSYSLELMRTSEELTGDEVRELIHRLIESGDAAADEAGPQPADQGKQ
jgi:hypothetical protein